MHCGHAHRQTFCGFNNTIVVYRLSQSSTTTVKADPSVLAADKKMWCEHTWSHSQERRTSPTPTTTSFMLEAFGGRLNPTPALSRMQLAGQGHENKRRKRTASGAEHNISCLLWRRYTSPRPSSRTSCSRICLQSHYTCRYFC